MLDSVIVILAEECQDIVFETQNKTNMIFKSLNYRETTMFFIHSIEVQIFKILMHFLSQYPCNV